MGRRWTTLEALDLETGAHLVFAKIGLAQTAGHATRIVCELTAVQTLDRATVRLGPRSSASAATAHLMLASDLAAPDRARLRCRYEDARTTTVTAAFTQIAAVNVATLTVQ